MRKILVIAAMIGFGSAAYAQKGGSGVHLGLAYGMASSSDTTEIGGVTADGTSKGSAYSLGAGYVFGNGVYLGAVYDGASMKDADDDDAEAVASSGMGVSVGFMRSGFQGVLHYILSSSASGGDSKISGGSGFGADLGYAWMFNPNFGMGAMVAYRSLSFNKIEFGGVEVDDATFKTTMTTPSLLFVVKF